MLYAMVVISFYSIRRVKILFKSLGVGRSSPGYLLVEVLTMKKVTLATIVCLSTLCMVSYARVQDKKEVISVEPIEELQEYPTREYEQIPFDGGIIFKEVGTGQEFVFTYTDNVIEVDETAPVLETTEAIPKIDYTDPAQNPYYKIEKPLKQDSKKRSTREICEEVSAIYPRVSAELLEAMCLQESDCDPNAFNGVDRGIMQVAKKWHSDRMKRLGVSDLSDPYGCVLVAADFLTELYEIADKSANGDTGYVLMRYNMTKKTADRIYKSGELSKYARLVLSTAEELKELYKNA